MSLTVNQFGFMQMPTMEAQANQTSKTTEKYDENGALLNTNVSIYDENNNQISSQTFDKNGKLTDYIYNVYDEMGKLTESYHDWDGDKIVDDASYYTYYSNGSLKNEAIDKDGDGDIDYNFPCEIEYTEEELEAQAQEAKKKQEEKIANMNIGQKALYYFGELIYNVFSIFA